MVDRRVRFVKVDTDENEQLASTLAVRPES